MLLKGAMNYKLLILITILLVLLIAIQANELHDIPSDADIVNTIRLIIRKTRSYGCNGKDNQEREQCRRHCQRRKYNGGRCSKATHYRQCVCYRSSESVSKKKSKTIKTW
ncbi:unnamed protein product [Rotaria socialis]